MLPNNSLSYISNNVKRTQYFEKRLILIQYFNKIGSTGVLFLQETYSDSKVGKNRKKILKVQFFLTVSEILVVS